MQEYIKKAMQSVRPEAFNAEVAEEEAILSKIKPGDRRRYFANSAKGSAAVIEYIRKNPDTKDAAEHLKRAQLNMAILAVIMGQQTER